MPYLRRGFTLVLGLAVTLTGCKDTLSPVQPGAQDQVRPSFAQGDNAVWTVTNLDDPGDDVCDDTDCTLREALAASSFNGSINFAPGLTGDVKLTAGELVVFDKNATIDGDGRIGIDAQRLSRVIKIDGGSRPRTLTLKGITIKNGYLADGNGAGVLGTSEGSLHLENVTVSDNEAVEGGGGIAIGTDSDLLMINSTVEGNRGNIGGGILALNSFTITGSTLSGNQAGLSGGGLYAGLGTSTLDRSTVSGNRVGSATGGSGGGIYLSDADLTVRSSTITDNLSEGTQASGGGILIGQGNLYMANTILAGNRAERHDDCYDFKGTSTSLGFNIYTSGDLTLCFGGGAIGDQEIVPVQTFTEVLEQTLKNNGGLTETHALIVRGRAMEKGYCPGETADQRGLARPVDIAIVVNAADGCDVGAYELQGPVIARTDLMVTQTSDKASVKAGDLLTYTVRVRNLGPELAPKVVLTNVLSSGVTFVSATHAKGTHTAPPVGETGTVTWNLGDLLDQANETTQIKVTVRIKGKTSIDNTASVTGDLVDINTANNTATLKVSVGAGGRIR